MHTNDAVFLEDLCPKFRLRQWRKSIHRFTGKSCIYCGKPSESIDHVLPRSQGGLSTTENCVPACLSCNGDKSDKNALYWYRKQKQAQKKKENRKRLEKELEEANQDFSDETIERYSY